MAEKKQADVEKLTRYEKARILGARALQIAMGSPFMVELSQEDIERLRYNPVEIAKLEFEKGLIPMTVRRPLPEVHSQKEEAQEQ